MVDKHLHDAVHDEIHTELRHAYVQIYGAAASLAAHAGGVLQQVHIGGLTQGANVHGGDRRVIQGMLMLHLLLVELLVLLIVIKLILLDAL